MGCFVLFYLQCWGLLGLGDRLVGKLFGCFIECEA